MYEPITRLDYVVEPVPRDAADPFITQLHYAKRWPSASYIYGLFFRGVLVGVVTYGSPVCAPVRSGLAGKDMGKYVIELNRLVLWCNRKNEASILVSRSLKLLPEHIVISYADISQGHIGYVYQACNFTYHGLSAKRTDWVVEGQEHLHNQTLVDEFRGKDNRSALMRAKYGDSFKLVPRPRKHRYLYINGSKTFKKEARKAIRYPQQPYPKGRDRCTNR